MQMVRLHQHICKLTKLFSRQEIQEQYIKDRYKLLGDGQFLKSHGVPDHDIAKITEISRSIYYRRKKVISVYGIQGLKRKSNRPHFGLKGMTSMEYHHSRS